MPRPPAGLAVLLVLWACATAAAQAQTPTLPVILKPGRPLVDSASDAITGYWRPEALPGALVCILDWLGGGAAIDAAPRFQATGFFDGSSFVGLARDTSRDSSGLGHRIKVIRLIQLAPNKVAVEFADDLRGKATSREIWMRVGRPGVDARESDVSDSASSGLPRLGEYVYVEELPEAIERVPPDYPEWARTKGISGTVAVQALIGKDGRVLDTHVTVSIPELDDYAVAAVKQWRFNPARSKGQPMAVWVTIPVKFTLH